MKWWFFEDVLIAACFRRQFIAFLVLVAAISFLPENISCKVFFFSLYFYNRNKKTKTCALGEEGLTA